MNMRVRVQRCYDLDLDCRYGASAANVFCRCRARVSQMTDRRPCPAFRPAVAFLND